MRKLSLAFLILASCAGSASQRDVANARIRYDIGVASLAQGDARGALRELLAAVKANPEFPDAHHGLALAYHRLGKTDKALKHYEEAVELKPKFSSAHNNMGGLLLELGRYDEAIESFKIALSDILYPTPSVAEGNMGWAYYRKGESDLAKQHIQNAVSTNPKFCRGYEWLARIGLDENQPGSVIKSYERFDTYCVQDKQIATFVKPQHMTQMQYYAALGFLKQGETGRAQKILSECVSNGTETPFRNKCQTSLRQISR